MDQYILELIEEIRTFQYPYKIQPPASIEAVDVLTQQAATILNYLPPAFYLDLLQATDGIDCNGFQLYASTTQKIAGFEDREGYMILSLAEANRFWREYELNKKYIFFAESGDVLYCQNLSNGKFEIVDRNTKELAYKPSSFNSCEELMQTLLNHMLDRYEVAETES